MPTLPYSLGTLAGTHSDVRPALASGCHGKAPPVDSFDGENPNVTFEDWFTTLQQAADWNHWSEEESLLQLAGHLRKRALLEWNLLNEEEKRDLSAATEALHVRLDSSSHIPAAEEFRHAIQRESESVAN